MAPPNPQDRPSYLLLLPPPPPPPSPPSPPSTFFSNIAAAYTNPLTTTLRQLQLERRKDPTGSILEIALPCPPLASQPSRPRAQLYPRVQKLLAALYKLVCVVAAREGVNVEDVRGVDVRALLLAQPHAWLQDSTEEQDQARDQEQDQAQTQERNQAQAQDNIPSSSSPISPIVPLETLARTGRPWHSVIAVSNEMGEALLKTFCLAQDGRVKIRRVPAGDTPASLMDGEGAQTETDEDVDEDAGQPSPKHHISIAVGGTFDHIHAGHKLLLTMFAFMLASPPPPQHQHQSQTQDEVVQRTLTIGITGDELLKNKKYAELLEGWDERQRIVVEFMRSVMDFRPRGVEGDEAEVKTEVKNEEGPNGHAVNTWLDERTVIKCVELSDPFGPTITDEMITALVISGETRSGGRAINEKRREKGWAGLEVFEVDVLDAREDASEHTSEHTIEDTSGGPTEGGREDKKKEDERESFEAKLSSTTIRQKIHEREEQQQRKAKAKPP